MGQRHLETRSVEVVGGAALGAEHQQRRHPLGDVNDQRAGGQPVHVDGSDPWVTLHAVGQQQRVLVVEHHRGVDGGEVEQRVGVGMGHALGLDALHRDAVQPLPAKQPGGRQGQHGHEQQPQAQRLKLLLRHG